MQESLHTILRGRDAEESVVRESGGDFSLSETLRELQDDMVHAAANMEYERAALLRDQITELKSGTGLLKLEPRKQGVKSGQQPGKKVARKLKIRKGSEMR